jgi:hypothetical protein
MNAHSSPWRARRADTVDLVRLREDGVNADLIQGAEAVQRTLDFAMLCRGSSTPMTDLERIAGSGKIAANLTVEGGTRSPATWRCCACITSSASATLPYFRNTAPPMGLENISKVPALAAALCKKGYSEADVRKTFGNTLREVNGK